MERVQRMRLGENSSPVLMKVNVSKDIEASDKGRIRV